MSNNPSGWLWLLMLFIGGGSSIFEKWSKYRKEERNRMDRYKNNTITSSMDIAIKNSDTREITEWGTDVEVSVEQAVQNQQKWRQERQASSENEETDFGEELNASYFEQEADLLEIPSSVVNKPHVRKRKRLTASNIRQAILYQEILNRPKRLR